MDREDRLLRVIASVATLGLVLCTANVASAFRTAADLPALDAQERVVWSSGLIAFDLVGELPEGLEHDFLNAAFSDASTTWAAVNCSGPSPILTTFERTEHVGADGFNTLAFVPASEIPGGLPRNTPAVTEVLYQQDAEGVWHIVEADIYVNADRDWDEGDDGLAVDLTTVLAHELGHVVGLLHTCEPDGADGAPECDESHEEALMFPLYYDASSALSEDDRLGYCELYPEPRCTLGERGCVEPDAELCALGECDDGGVDDDVTGADAGVAADAGVRDLEFASPCAEGAECSSGLCLGPTAESAVCTRACGGDSGVCPQGFACEAVTGQSVCVGDSRESSCAVARVGTGASRLQGAVFGAFAWATALRLRRRRRAL